MTISSKTLFSPIALAVLCGSCYATAQQPVAASPVEPKKTEVTLPVAVRDKKGQHVPNLKAGDFTLNDNGDPQTIAGFAPEASQPFRIGLMIDTSRGQEDALASERAATGKFVDQMISRPADKAFLLHFDRQVELLQDFTSKPAKLHRELDEMTARSDNPRSGERGGDSSESDDRPRRGGTQIYDAIYLAANELMLKEPGLKALVLITDGIDRGSKETLNDAIDAADKANLTIYTVYSKGEEERSGSQDGPRIERPGSYPGNPGGGRGTQRPGGGAPGVKVDGKKTLEKISTRTGGLFFEAKKKDSLDEIYAQIALELRGLYLLTYTPDKASAKDASDNFHKVLLKAKDDKLTVITREGYFAAE